METSTSFTQHTKDITVNESLIDYLKWVLAHLRLVKHLPLQPTEEDVKELQNVDWLIEETEERILDEEKKDDN
jgi:hypothetical protein